MSRVVGSKLQCQEQCIDHVPEYLLALFPTTFLKIAVCGRCTHHEGGVEPRGPSISLDLL